MSALHLKKLAHDAINYLTNIFNLSISTGQIPEIWHKAVIIPIIKPGKDDNIGKNWRPISLLCPAVNTLKKLLQPKMLTPFPFQPVYYLFWPKLSTCTDLWTITATLHLASQEKSWLVVLDLTADCIRYCGPSTTDRLCPQH